MSRSTDIRDNVKVVTANDFITAHGLENLPLNSRKLLYLAISQCRKTDKEFFEYFISAKDFADIMGIDESNVYRDGTPITAKLMRLVIECKLNGKGYEQYTLFTKCSYIKNEGVIMFKFNPDMTNFFLNLKRDFTQPLLADFVHMNSPYSMAIWHLMQREMHSRKPGITQTIEFDLTLDELRKVTGCEEKLKQVGQFKERVLDKTIREIRDNCGVVITYDNMKCGRNVTGFHFRAEQEYHINADEILETTRDRAANGKQRIKVALQKKGLSQ